MPDVRVKCLNSPKTAPAVSIKTTQESMVDEILRKSLKCTTKIEALLSELL